MKSLSKDLIEKITNELSPSELLILCDSKVNKVVNTLCNNNDFWIRKFQKDFGVLLKFNCNKKLLLDAKELYKTIFSNIDKNIKSIVKGIIDSFGNKFKIYINSEYEKNLYKKLYDIILVIFNDLSADDFYHPDIFGDKVYSRLDTIMYDIIPPMMLDSDSNNEHWDNVIFKPFINCVDYIVAICGL